jgi:hypothetical protein
LNHLTNFSYKGLANAEKIADRKITIRKLRIIDKKRAEKKTTSSSSTIVLIVPFFI